MDMTGFTGSNYFRAEDLEPDVRIEATIVSVVERDFVDGPKRVAFTDYRAKGVVLNPTRTKVLVEAFRPNSHCVGKTIFIFRDGDDVRGQKGSVRRN